MHTAASSSTAAKKEVDTYLAERNKYKQRSEQRVKKGSEREAETLKMLATFQSKMERSRRLAEYVSAGVADDVDEDEESERREDDNEDDDTNDLSWLVPGLCLDYFGKFILNVCFERFNLLVRRGEGNAVEGNSGDLLPYSNAQVVISMGMRIVRHCHKILELICIVAIKWLLLY